MAGWTLGRSNKGVLSSPQSSCITGASPSDCFCYIWDTLWRSLTPLQRSSWCFLLPQPAGPGYSLGELYLSAEKQSVYSTAPANWDTGYSLGEYTHPERSSRCILQSQPTGPKTHFGGVLPLRRDTVGVFYSPSQLGHRTLFRGVLPLCRDTVDVLYSPPPPIRLDRISVE